MSDRINVTEFGRNLLELENIPIIESVNRSRKKDSVLLPSLSKENLKTLEFDHKQKLYCLPKRLNGLYSSTIVKKAKEEAEESIKNLGEELLKDVANKNEYLSQKAQKMAKGMFYRMQTQKQSLLTKVSKNRNYLARINNLHRSSNSEYDKISKRIKERSRSPKYSDEEI